MFVHKSLNTAFATVAGYIHPAVMQTYDQIPRHIRGQVLRNLRHSRNKSLEEIARLLTVTRQVVSKWELGKSDIPLDNLLRILAYLEFTDEQFYSEAKRVAEFQGTTFSLSGPTWHDGFPEDLTPFRAENSEMSPYAEQGELVFFDKTRRPKPMEGCVVRLKSGEIRLRRFVSQKDQTYFFAVLNPDKTELVQSDQVDFVARIALRGDR
ncbi:LexA family transcriptional regulator [Asticcacaulis excentricus]|uniref:LexA family transcriptional regulator n=1 Tax=Asticcacaulis excentricus TaxID=78587 RepID=UPI001561C583|nr:LexA family transcriptional regulator [Asticcacaulis excentricus]